MSIKVFISSVQKELELERAAVASLIATDPFLLQHCVPVLFEKEPQAARPAKQPYLEALKGCQAYVLMIANEYGNPDGEISATHHEYRLAQKLKLPTVVFLKGAKDDARSKEVQALIAEAKRDGYRPCSRNPLIAQTLATLGVMEQRGSGFARMREAMLNHGLDEPKIGEQDGFFVVTLAGPAGDYERIKTPTNVSGLVTPAKEAQLNERQKRMVALLVAGERLTSRRCEQEFGVTRDTAARDFALLLKLEIAARTGRGRSVSYGLKGTA